MLEKTVVVVVMMGERERRRTSAGSGGAWVCGSERENVGGDGDGSELQWC